MLLHRMLTNIGAFSAEIISNHGTLVVHHLMLLLTKLKPLNSYLSGGDYLFFLTQKMQFEFTQILPCSRYSCNHFKRELHNCNNVEELFWGYPLKNNFKYKNRHKRFTVGTSIIETTPRFRKVLVLSFKPRGLVKIATAVSKLMNNEVISRFAVVITVCEFEST
ncbi:unnamed protein product [Moneuplotes crassus]|uniref:Uncharacterized protein n=1 Tax=Euplotes crassus TaxID=5936 RepID=A0AAD1U8A5_EUPCR|nr:unnamed protein product [Moneuplotes crassus]